MALNIRTPQPLPALYSIPQTHSVQHFVQYAYSRLISIRVPENFSPSDVIRHIAFVEGQRPEDYRWLRMTTEEQITKSGLTPTASEARL